LASNRESADDGHRQRHPHYEHRLLLIAALCATPFALFCILLVAGLRPSPEVGIAWLLLALGLSLLGLRVLKQQAAYPLRTVATLLEALREGDYLQRGRMDMPKDALGELIRDVNQLRDTLHPQRVKVRETTALITKVGETVDIAVFTFGPDQRLRLVNAAGGPSRASRPNRTTNCGRWMRRRCSSMTCSTGRDNTSSSVSSPAPVAAGRYAIARSARAARYITCWSLPISAGYSVSRSALPGNGSSRCSATKSITR
jgi:hypothetical protein